MAQGPVSATGSEVKRILLAIHHPLAMVGYSWQSNEPKQLKRIGMTVDRYRFAKFMKDFIPKIEI